MNGDYVTLDSICERIGDGIHGTPSYDCQGDYYFFNGSDIVDGRLHVSSSTKRINSSEYEKYKRVLTSQSLLLSINGTIGNVASYNGERCLLGKSIAYLTLKSNIDKHYIQYVLKSRNFQEYIENANGSTIKNVSLKMIRDYAFFLPSFDIQRTIGHYIGIIDELIMVKRKSNDNLQEQRRMAFKQLWDSLDYSHIVSLETIAHLQKQTWKPSDKQELLEHYSIPAYDDNQYPSFDESSTIQSNKTVVVPNSILVSKLNPGTKRVCRPLCMTQNAVCSTEFLSIIPNDMGYAQYIYSVIDSEDYNYYLINNATGSTGSRQRVLPSIAMQYELPLPSKDTIKHYSLFADAIDQQIRTNMLEMQSLKDLRDYLLPKLMSGEIDVSTLEIPN